MKESGPEIEERTFGKHILRVAKGSAVFAITMAALTAVLIILKETESPNSKEKYRIHITTKPSEDGGAPDIEVEFVRQCVDRVVHAAPSLAGKTYYKDCE